MYQCVYIHKTFAVHAITMLMIYLYYFNPFNFQVKPTFPWNCGVFFYYKFQPPYFQLATPTTPLETRNFSSFLQFSCI